MPVARPKDAASLILVRRDSAMPRLLMGRRAGSHAFVPGKWVFPGGKLERADYQGPLRSDLRPEVAAHLASSARLRRQDGPRFARALARAAIRETYEETGLLLGRRAGGGIEADLGPLLYVARAITPPALPRRFDARFLLAEAVEAIAAEGLSSLEPRGNGELDEIGWFSLDECRRLDMIAITRAVLRVVEGHLEGGAEESAFPFWRATPGNPSPAL